MLSVVFRSTNKISILFAMMILSSIGFSITYFISSNNSYIFYFTCIISGFGLGGESVIILAIAADVMKKYSDYGNIFFSIWSSVSKISLALGAGIFLPLISMN
jgi:hypothetical protein